jgi:Peptidase A4 family
MAEARWSRRRSGLAAAAALTAIAAAVGSGGPAGNADTSSFAQLRSAALTANVSANWAGYAVTGSQTVYSSATGTWIEPTVTCGADDAGEAAAFWVGLGGYDLNSPALEQVGTASDCDATTGEPSYYAWYELVPNPAVTIKLKVEPGDLVTTSVNVLPAGTIELQIKNRSRHTTFTTKLPFSNPDLSSAEWIAEAPSGCDQYRCQPIPLSDFGSVAFTKIAALGNGVGGTLTTNPGWTTTGVTLDPSGGRGFYPGPETFASDASSLAGATPSAVSTDGRSFTIQWSANAGGGSG